MEPERGSPADGLPQRKAEKVRRKRQTASRTSYHLGVIRGRRPAGPQRTLQFHHAPSRGRAVVARQDDRGKSGVNPAQSRYGVSIAVCGLRIADWATETSLSLTLSPIQNPTSNIQNPMSPNARP